MTTARDTKDRLNRALEATSEDWLRALRSAYEIPVVVGNDTAVKAIRAELRVQMGNSGIREEHCESAAELILAAVLELLRSGELDQCLLPDDLRRHFCPINPGARIASQSGVAGGSDDVGVRAVAESLFDRILATVREMPAPSQPFAFYM